MSASARPSPSRRAASRAPIRSRKLHSAPHGWTMSNSSSRRTTRGSRPLRAGSSSRRIAPAPAASGGRRSSMRSKAFSLRHRAPIRSARASLASRRPSASCFRLRRPSATSAVRGGSPRRTIPPRRSTSCATSALGTWAKRPIRLTILPASSVIRRTSGGFALLLRFGGAAPWRQACAACFRPPASRPRSSA